LVQFSATIIVFYWDVNITSVEQVNSSTTRRQADGRVMTRKWRNRSIASSARCRSHVDVYWQRPAFHEDSDKREILLLSQMWRDGDECGKMKKVGR